MNSREADARLIDMVSGQMLTFAREMSKFTLALVLIGILGLASTAWLTWRMTQMLIYLTGIDVSPCFPPFCGACPYWSEMEIKHESDWGVCEKKLPPDNLTRVHDSCSEKIFY